MPEILPFLRGFLSQWHPSPFVLDGEAYGCAEQFMMHRKALLFCDAEMAARIMRAGHPSDQKRLGQQVRGFAPEVWDAHKVDIVTAGNRAKFGQNSGLRRKLLATGQAVLVEANRKDVIWGVGLAETDPDIRDPAKWRGENLLGQVLMRVRGELREIGVPDEHRSG